VRVVAFYCGVFSCIFNISQQCRDLKQIRDVLLLKMCS
jgi:hypothetical protein